uniref:Uncharacterized protein n=1 Tax=Panagrolaimus davidi TaxID=227884 RepID=A0A914Q9X4_9BILA
MSDIAQYKVSEQIFNPAQGNQMNQSLPRHSSGDLIDPLAIPKRVIIPTVRYIPTISRDVSHHENTDLILFKFSNSF